MNKLKTNINIILYIIYLTIYIVTVSLYGFGNSVANMRYYCLFILCVIGFIYYLVAKKKKIAIINREFLFSILVSVVFLLFSYSKSYNANVPLSIRTYVQISLFLFPTLYAFYISNFMSRDDIIKMMKITMFFLIFAYFFDKTEPNHHILEFFKIKNWLNVDYLHSNSFTESHNWSESFLQLFMFFYYCYYSSTEKNSGLRKYLIVSLIFTLLCFKRLSILIVMFIVLFGKKIINTKPKKYYYIIFIIFFLITTIFYTKFMKNEIFDYDTVFKITTGRNWILKMWELKGYLSYGYGSCMLVIGRYLEMDLIEIYLELNILCLFLFLYCYFNISKNSNYCLFITFFAFLNMLTASSLPWQISWVVMMINISFILKNDKLKGGV